MVNIATGRLTARKKTLFRMGLTFRLAGHFFQLIPQFVGHRLQSTELACPLQPFTPVDRDDLAIDVSRKIRKQECRQVSQLLVVAHTLKRHALSEIEL